VNKSVACARVALSSSVSDEHSVGDIVVGDPVPGGAFGSVVGEDDADRRSHRA